MSAASWWRKVKRRKGGIYLWRTDRHTPRPAWLRALIGNRENGYVGETTSFTRRDRDHRGQSTYARRVTRKSMGQAAGLPDVHLLVERTTQKPWMDLNARRHTIIALPWWLCWKPVLRALETLVILAAWPRYNHAKNLWNPRRVALSEQKRQRQARDARGGRAYAGVQLARLGWGFVRLAGIACILAGIGVPLVGRWL